MKILNVTIVALACGFFPIFADAQSRDRDKPTPITSGNVSGASRKEDPRELYYALTAGPGELVVTLEVEGLSGRADRESLVRLTVYDQDFHELGRFDRQSGLNGERNRRVERYNFPKETPLVIRLTFEGGASKYRIRLGGDSPVDQPANSPVTSSESLRLPKSGVLTIKMRDGSVHTLNLADVQNASIETESPRRR